MAPQDAALLQCVERAANGGERRSETAGEGVQVRVAMSADVLLDEVDSLLLGHALGEIRR